MIHAIEWYAPMIYIEETTTSLEMLKHVFDMKFKFSFKF